MRSQTSTTTIVVVEMSLEEAEWLANQMQNPLHGQSPTDETVTDRSMRERFFHAARVIKPNFLKG